MATRKKAVEAKTKAQSAPAAAEQPPVVIAYKGFDKNLVCNPKGKPFQYEIGKTYEHKGAVSACNSGFHACQQHPLSVLSFYGLKDGNRYAIVEQSGEMAHEKDKTASQIITIKAEIKVSGLIKAAVEWTMAKAAKPTSGNYAHSATSGNSAHSATSGYYAHSATSGDYAHSATSGDYANSATSGYYAHSATSGYAAHSATSGNDANSATSGSSAHSEAKGENAVAANAGNGKARAGACGAIFLVERDDNLNILAVFASKVGENGIQPDVWYVLRDGKPEEA